MMLSYDWSKDQNQDLLVLLSIISEDLSHLSSPDVLDWILLFCGIL